MSLRESLSDRPRTIGIAVILLCISYGMGLLSTIIQTSMATHEVHLNQLVSSMLNQLLLLVCWWFFIISVRDGRGWTRPVLLILVLLTIPSMLSAIHALASAPFFTALRITQFILEVGVIVLLFLKPSADWFKQRHQELDADTPAAMQK